MSTQNPNHLISRTIRQKIEDGIITFHPLLVVFDKKLLSRFIEVFLIKITKHPEHM